MLAGDFGDRQCLLEERFVDLQRQLISGQLVHQTLIDSSQLASGSIDDDGTAPLCLHGVLFSGDDRVEENDIGNLDHIVSRGRQCHHAGTEELAPDCIDELNRPEQVATFQCIGPDLSHSGDIELQPSLEPVWSGELEGVRCGTRNLPPEGQPVIDRVVRRSNQRHQVRAQLGHLPSQVDHDRLTDGSGGLERELSRCRAQLLELLGQLVGRGGFPSFGCSHRGGVDLAEPDSQRRFELVHPERVGGGQVDRGRLHLAGDDALQENIDPAKTRLIELDRQCPLAILTGCVVPVGNEIGSFDLHQQVARWKQHRDTRTRSAGQVELITTGPFDFASSDLHTVLGHAFRLWLFA